MAGNKAIDTDNTLTLPHPQTLIVKYTKQGPEYSDRVNAWLEESDKTAPWHGLAGVAMSRHRATGYVVEAASDAAATQGSGKSNSK